MSWSHRRGYREPKAARSGSGAASRRGEAWGGASGSPGRVRARRGTSGVAGAPGAAAAPGAPGGPETPGAAVPDWALRNPVELASELGSDLAAGLEPTEVVRRLDLFGPNEIAGRASAGPLKMLLSQFTDFMVLVLLAAAAISFFLGETADTAAIAAIVCLNAVLGFLQEYRAERALETLREMTAPTARVVRAGQELTVDAREVVPGDVVVIEEGDRVPADMRIVRAHALWAQEAALTGESTPVPKSPAPPAGPARGLGDLSSALFMGTEAVAGRGRALVTATGMETEFGKIAGLISAAGGDPTPLQRRLGELGRYLVVACLLISGLVVWAGVLRGEDPYNMVLAGVSLAVAAIPEGLPAVVTIVLALGVQRMIRRNVIVRKLPAVETLGCATVICSDKTGTLTENEMTVRRLWTPADEYTVTGRGFSLTGRLRRTERRSAEAGDSLSGGDGGGSSDAGGTGAPHLARDVDAALRFLLLGGVLCSNARFEPPAGTGRRGEHGCWSDGESGGESEGDHVGDHNHRVLRGDPTEGALVVAGVKAGLDKAALERRFPRLSEAPFSSERRRMTTLHRWEKGSLMAFCKGAPDTVLGLCTQYHGPRGPETLAPEDREHLTSAADNLAALGLRVLAVAYRPLAPSSGGVSEASQYEGAMIFAGLAGMSDPPRPEVRGAIDLCRRAGVRVNMITGDHPATALAVAREIGLLDARLPVERQVLTGAELDLLPDRRLVRRAADIRVYARVSPGHKLRIVRALRTRGEVVAMTGDGVNDAPAVKEADIGVAMGQTGTEVTKEASDMILTDDNFASIVAALEEGRVIYDNIRRFIRYLLSCNTGEVVTMMVGALLRLPLPLLPIQILWVNLVTDGLPALALGLQARESDVLTRPPRSPKESIFSRRLGAKVLGRGLIIGLSTVGAFLLALQVPGGDLASARTVAFGTLVLSQLVHAFDCRSETRSLTGVSLASNWYLVGATAVSLVMFLAVLYVPAARPFFRTTPLGFTEWSWVIIASVWGQVLVGLRRAVLYRLDLARRPTATPPEGKAGTRPAVSRRRRPPPRGR